MLVTVFALVLNMSCATTKVQVKQQMQQEPNVEVLACAVLELLVGVHYPVAEVKHSTIECRCLYKYNGDIYLQVTGIPLEVCSDLNPGYPPLNTSEEQNESRPRNNEVKL